MTQRKYPKLVTACEKFQKDRRVEPLQNLIPHARLYVYGFRSLIGSLEITRNKIWEIYTKFKEDNKWNLTPILNQLDTLIILNQLEIPNDFRAVTVHFAINHKTLFSIKENLERICENSGYGLKDILSNFTQAVKHVTESNGIYQANWKKPPQWNVLYVPDVGLKVVKLIYANRHSLNLAIIPNKVGTHSHAYTSEIHFSLEPTDGDQIVGDFRLHVTESYAVPIKPEEWHGYEENKSQSPHQLLFLTGSPEILGWGIVIDRTLTDSSELKLKSLSYEKIDEVGGVLIEKAIQDIEHRAKTKTLEKELISSSSTNGINLGFVAIPDIWKSYSKDVIHLVLRGEGIVSTLGAEKRIKEGDVFGIPYEIDYIVKNEGRRPLILLSSILQD